VLIDGKSYCEGSALELSRSNDEQVRGFFEISA
jgi:hypothetical protein